LAVFNRYSRIGIADVLDADTGKEAAVVGHEQGRSDRGRAGGKAVVHEQRLDAAGADLVDGCNNRLVRGYLSGTDELRAEGIIPGLVERTRRVRRNSRRLSRRTAGVARSVRNRDVGLVRRAGVLHVEPGIEAVVPA